MEYEITELKTTPYASGGFGLWGYHVEEKWEEKEVEEMYTVKLKDGDYGRLKNGTYGSMDLVSTHEDLAPALAEFLELIDGAKSDAQYGDKPYPVTLTFKAKKVKDKKN